MYETSLAISVPMVGLLHLDPSSSLPEGLTKDFFPNLYRIKDDKTAQQFIAHLVGQWCKLYTVRSLYVQYIYISDISMHTNYCICDCCDISFLELPFHVWHLPALKVIPLKTVHSLQLASSMQCSFQTLFLHWSRRLTLIKWGRGGGSNGSLHLHLFPLH